MEPPFDYRTCYISAPYGMDLQPLHSVLNELGVRWQWAETNIGRDTSPHSALRISDWFLGVVTRSTNTSRILYEAGIAVGLGKPVLLLVTEKQVLPIDDGLVSIVRLSLKDTGALRFHLEIFMDSPHRDLSSEQYEASIEPTQSKYESLSKDVDLRNLTELELGDQVVRIVENAGGKVLREPSIDQPRRTYRPDLLIWLAEQDSQLLNPAIIELKRVVTPDDMRGVEEQLLSFIQTTRLPLALAVTATTVPERRWKKSTRIVWLNIRDFETLVLNGELGSFIRDKRNRDAHGKV